MGKCIAIGEFDMVVADPQKGTCDICEIKHTAERTDEQFRHLADSEKCAAEDARLSVTQPEGAVFRLGTTACLDVETLKRVRVNGRHVVQNADGSFSPCGMILLLR